MFPQLQLKFGFPLTDILTNQGDIVRYGGVGCVDVLHRIDNLTAFCRGAVTRGRESFPSRELQLLDLVVNQHDEGAGYHQDSNERY